MLNNRRYNSRYDSHFAHKSLGQNFLVDQAIIDLIVLLISPTRGERMIEIGPGLGALTRPLIARLATIESPLHAIEIDKNLVRRLKKMDFAPLLKLYMNDVLKFDFSSLALPGDLPSLRIVGNLPYNISSPILFHLMKFSYSVIDQYFMLQSEVVERMISKPGAKTFSRMSVMLQHRYAIDKLFNVPPESFRPSPKVNSSIVQMVPYAKNELMDVDITVLSEITTAAFSKRRKMLRNTLIDYLSVINFDRLGFDLERRAEDVSVNEYVRIAQILANIRKLN